MTICRGETLGVVGESGCGKSTFARTILRLVEATGGEVYYKGQNILEMDAESVRKLRRHFQMIFQDPYASLNPRQTVESILSEPFIIHEICSREEAKKKAAELLEMVDLPEESLKKYPHEFSGGQRQRICIARAMAVMPDIIICDECVSALDVSIQAQIINMLMELQKKYGLTLIFISHDLRVVRHISDKIAVMYLGDVVEYGDKESLYADPRHPYTKALLSAVPVADPTREKTRIHLEGEIPSPINRPEGCGFCTRCSMADEECRTKMPGTYRLSPTHEVRCSKVGGTLIETGR